MVAPKDANKSISSELQLVLNTVNRYARAHPERVTRQHRVRLIDALQRLSNGSGRRPTWSEAANFYQKFVASNQHVRQRYFPRGHACLAQTSRHFPSLHPTNPSNWMPSLRHYLRSSFSERSMGVKGFVDYFEPPNVIGGWASDTSCRPPVRLEAFRNSTPIGRGETSFFRSDTGGNHGFRLALSDVVIPNALAFPEIRVFAVGADKTAIEIPFHPHVINKARFLLARALVTKLDDKQRASLAERLVTTSRVNTSGRSAATQPVPGRRSPLPVC